MCGILRQMQADRRAADRKKPVRASAIVHGGTIMALLSAHGEESGKGYFDYQTANGRGYLCSLDARHAHTASRSGGETGPGERIRLREIMEL